MVTNEERQEEEDLMATKKQQSRQGRGRERAGGQAGRQEKRTSHMLEGRSEDRRKQSVYLPKSMLDEVEKQAVRLDRSLSWLVQIAWELAASQISRMESLPLVIKGRTRLRLMRRTGKGS